MKINLIAVLLLLTNVWANETPKTGSKKGLDCICTMIYAPVCANGKTFGNSCQATCAGATKYEEGECKTALPKGVKPKITPTYKKKK